MEEIASLIAACIKYGDYAVQFEGMLQAAWPKLSEYLGMAIMLFVRGKPLTDQEKANVIANEDDVHQMLQDDMAAREAEAAAMQSGKAELSGR